MNKVLLIGRLVKQAELKRTVEKQIPYVRFRVAVNRDLQREGSENSADFIQITMWGKKAENMAEFLTKGRLVNVVGSLRSGRYEKEDGTMRYYTEVFAEKLYFVDTKSNIENENAS